MAGLLSSLSVIAFIAAAVALAFAVFLFFLFKIPKVMSDLSGRTARKSIAKIRSSNENTGNKSYRPGGPNAERVKLTDNIPESQKSGGNQLLQEKPAESVEAEQLETTTLIPENKAGTLSDSTGLLVDPDATGKLVDVNETEPLAGYDAQSFRPEGKKLTMIEAVVMTHTEEKIS